GLSESGAALACVLLAAVATRGVPPSLPRFVLPGAVLALLPLALAAVAFPPRGALVSGRAVRGEVRPRVAAPREAAVFKTAADGSLDFWSGLVPIRTVGEI